MVQKRKACHVHGQLVGEHADFPANGVAHCGGATGQFLGDEQEVSAVVADIVEVHLQGAAQHALVGQLFLTDLAHHMAQGAERFIQQGQAQGAHVREMPVEGGGDHAGSLGHFAQAEAGEGGFLDDQIQRRRHQSFTGLAPFRLAGSAGGFLGHYRSPLHWVSGRWSGLAGSFSTCFRLAGQEYAGVVAGLRHQQTLKIRCKFSSLWGRDATGAQKTCVTA